MATTSENPDGFTSTTHPDDEASVTYQPPAVSVDPARKIPSLFAAQLAVSQLLEGIVATVKDDENVVTGRSPNGRQVKMTTIYIDWPPNEAEMLPATATILEADDQDFGDEVSAARYLEDTADKFGEGTVLFRQAFSTVKLAVHMTFAHRDDRRAFRAELEDWLAEPQTDRKAQANIYALVAGLTCLVPVLRLITRPKILRPHVDAGLA
jgi:hypothetical protein